MKNFLFTLFIISVAVSACSQQSEEELNNEAHNHIKLTGLEITFREDLFETTVPGSCIEERKKNLLLSIQESLEDVFKNRVAEKDVLWTISRTNDVISLKTEASESGKPLIIRYDTRQHLTTCLSEECALEKSLQLGNNLLAGDSFSLHYKEAKNTSSLDLLANASLISRIQE